MTRPGNFLLSIEYYYVLPALIHAMFISPAQIEILFATILIKTYLQNPDCARGWFSLKINTALLLFPLFMTNESLKY